MEQLNRLTRSLRRARTVELPEGEAPRERALDFAGGAGGRWESAGARPSWAGTRLPGGVRSRRKCPRGPAGHPERVRCAPGTGSGSGPQCLPKLWREVGGLAF